ncbi:MAG: efflux RND transporter periplasmic adaptor subunit [Planctomycetota bacterium]|jgi:Cu(I)/Ag(I) efflux system membrane fusion protein
MKKYTINLPWKILAAIFIVLAAFAVGYFTRGKILQDKFSSTHAKNDSPKEQMWTCSMHPQIQQPKPGKCPICFMDLIPVGGDEHSGHTSERQITFSPESLKLMEIETVPVERKFVEAEIRMVGKIDFDETRVQGVTAWVPGRIDRMYVDFTGTRVIKGDHMFDLYSPDLISAQAEFLEAIKAAEKLTDESSGMVRRSTEANLEASKEKLRLLGLADAQIQDIQQADRATDHITINAPHDGVVIEKHVSEGAYVKTGTAIYTIADLSHLWVQLDAYESDMMWVRFGQNVEFTTEAYPGQVFKERITFISPTLDAATRTIKLRVNADNSDGTLKPGMFVRGTVRSKVASRGLVADPDIAGKWICPMHPSVIKEQQGQCDICQMDLVKTDSLGYTEAVSQQAPLVIPATAPLITGKRAIVYVQLPNTEKPTFQGRQVVLGPRAGGYYLVEKGLAEGEQVVIQGNFKIDSALQIQAKPSMMSPQDDIISGEQEFCPVMGGKINKDVFIEYKGKKVYFCCPGCDKEFRADPEKYIKKLPQFQEK